MARTPYDFQSVFDAAVRACGQVPATVAADATLLSTFLQIFNRTHQIGYDLPADGWADARTGATVTPSSRLITHDTLGDAREFNLFTEDPRVDTSQARRVAFTENAAGILITESELTTVWVSWLPETLEFTTTAWATATTYAVGDRRLVTASGHCYRCLVAHTSGTFATDLAASKWMLMPVLAVLKEFCIAHTQGTYLRESCGQPETGLKLQAVALADLDKKATQEAQRLNR